MSADPNLTEDAELSDEQWTSLWSWESLRYGGSGWWLDRVLPKSPLGVVLVALGLPILWFAIGFAITPDREEFLGTHDVTGQLWFFPLHVFAMRVVGRLWADGLAPALDGLALDEKSRKKITAGALGKWASIGAILACTFFMLRDAIFGFMPNAAGVIPFDDPEMWDMAAIGRSVQVMMLGLWCLEWLMFGYLLWLQIWILASWLRELHRTDFTRRLEQVLVGDGYRNAFTLFSKTASVSLVFALGNLGFITYTDELIPREVVHVQGVGDFLREMSDLLSTSLLFVLTLVAIVMFVRILRASLTRAVNRRFAEAGDIALKAMATSTTETDLPALATRVEAQAGLLRAVVFQREVDVVGGKTMMAMVAKASVPLATSALKMRKVLGL